MEGQPIDDQPIIKTIPLDQVTERQLEEWKKKELVRVLGAIKSLEKD